MESKGLMLGYWYEAKRVGVRMPSRKGQGIINCHRRAAFETRIVPGRQAHVAREEMLSQETTKTNSA